MMKNEKPKNKEGQRHGYWEYYYLSGKLYYKGNYINDYQDGYWEYYYSNEQLSSKEYFV